MLEIHVHWLYLEPPPSISGLKKKPEDEFWAAQINGIKAQI